MQSLRVLQRASSAAYGSQKNHMQSFRKCWVSYSKVTRLELTFSVLN